jgi:hypothetical protein
VNDVHSWQFHAILLWKNCFDKPYQNQAFSIAAQVFQDEHRHKIELLTWLQVNFFAAIMSMILFFMKHSKAINK